MRPRPEVILLLAGLAATGVILFRHLGYPLLWQDEAETAVFATRVVEYGFPKVHGERNVVYEFGANVAIGVKESVDAYIGTTWGHFYLAVPGLLWARGTEDLYARTARLRLPFALAGAAGLGVMLWAVLPAFRGEPRRRLAFAACYFACTAVSVSLLLHLRELRYYPLLVLALGAVLGLHLRRAVFATLAARAYALALTPLLFLLFNLFYPAYFVTLALLAASGLASAWRAPGSRREPLLSLVPLLASVACVAPLVVFFETFHVAAAFSRDVGLTPGGILENLREVVVHFLRHEFLAPALVCRGALLATQRLAPEPAPPESRAAARLAAFAAGWLALVCLNPLVYERYFVVLSPVVTLVFLLDAFALARRLPGLVAPARRRAARAAALAALCALAGASALVRAPELRGRWAELREPYRGPLDYAIAYLAEKYSDPERLVIATNYANHPFMYYLGSHVIVGTNLNNIARERALLPDVVIPRRRWPRGLEELRRFLARGGYASHRLPVADVHFNNVPALSRSRAVPAPHRFRTPRSDDPREQLEIFELQAPQGGGRSEAQPRGVGRDGPSR